MFTNLSRNCKIVNNFRRCHTSEANSSFKKLSLYDMLAKALNGEKINQKAVRITGFNLIAFPGSWKHEAEVIFVDSCDVWFVDVNIKKNIFPKATKLYLSCDSYTSGVFNESFENIYITCELRFKGGMPKNIKVITNDQYSDELAKYDTEYRKLICLSNRESEEDFYKRLEKNSYTKE